MPRERTHALGQVRDRWRMGSEARGLVLVMALVLVFGLAVLYSASAIVAMQENRNSWYYVARQATGVLAGTVAFAVAAKFDAETLRDWAWPIMYVTIVTLFLCLVLPEWIAPRINGSKRFLFGTSLQPSEFGKLGVVIWTSMLIVKKGDQLRRLTKGVLPFFVVIGVLDILAALEPDLSVAMLYTLMLAVLLFAGGVRIAHFVALCALAIPVLWTKIEKVQYAALRLTAFFDPGGAPTQMKYQLKQSLIAVGSGGLFGVGFGQGRQQYGFLPFPYSAAGISHRAEGAVAVPAARGGGTDLRHCAHGLPAYRRRGRNVAYYRAYPPVCVVWAVQHTADDAHDRNPGEHRQREGTRGRQWRDRSALSPGLTWLTRSARSSLPAVALVATSTPASPSRARSCVSIPLCSRSSLARSAASRRPFCRAPSFRIFCWISIRCTARSRGRTGVRSSVPLVGGASSQRW
jgi:hypothetical protein